MMRSMLCSLAVYHSPGEVKLIVVTRHPELWSWLVWLPHNQHDEMFDACGLPAPAGVQLAHRVGGGPRRRTASEGPGTVDGAGRVHAVDDALTDGGRIGTGLGPHWVIVDDNVGTPEQWEVVTGQKGMAGITVLRLATGRASESDTDADQRFRVAEGRLRHRGGFYAVADTLAESTADRYARAWPAGRR